MLKFISWNVNGYRAVLNKKAFTPILKSAPDFLCLQETKLSQPPLPKLDFPQYPFQCFHCAEKKGYSGTVIFAKQEPLKCKLDFPSSHKHPQEGRTITLEYSTFFLVNTYVPNAQAVLKRLPYRDKKWDPHFHTYLKALAKKKPVIACGDFNVAHAEIDLANPNSNRNSAGFTDQERNNFTKLLKAGFIDTFRHQHPDKPDYYSWWSYRTKARERNVGWRLDYFLISTPLLPKLKKASILAKIEGSDHAPVALSLQIS